MLPPCRNAQVPHTHTGIISDVRSPHACGPCRPRAISCAAAAGVRRRRFAATASCGGGNLWWRQLRWQQFKEAVCGRLIIIIYVRTHVIQLKNMSPPKKKKERAFLPKQSSRACGKPETPQVGLGDPNTYKNVTHINKCFICNGKYAL